MEFGELGSAMAYEKCMKLSSGFPSVWVLIAQDHELIIFIFINSPNKMHNPILFLDDILAIVSFRVVTGPGISVQKMLSWLQTRNLRYSCYFVAFGLIRFLNKLTEVVLLQYLHSLESKLLKFHGTRQDTEQVVH